MFHLFFVIVFVFAFAFAFVFAFAFAFVFVFVFVFDGLGGTEETMSNIPFFGSFSKTPGPATPSFANQS